MDRDDVFSKLISSREALLSNARRSLEIPTKPLRCHDICYFYCVSQARRSKLRTCSCERSKSTISVYVKQAVFRGRHRDGNEEKAKAVSKLVLTETMVIYSIVFHTRVQATCIALQITGHVKNQRWTIKQLS